MEHDNVVEATTTPRQVADDCAPSPPQMAVARRVARKALNLSPFADSMMGGAEAGSQLDKDLNPQARKSAAEIADEGFSGPAGELPNRSVYEASFGRKFDHVRVYTDAAANKACLDMGARAYCSGHRIAVASPELINDQALMSHELTHVGQHTGVARKGDGGGGDGIDVSGEDEAEKVEAAVASGKPARSALEDGEGEAGSDSDSAGADPARKGPARKDNPWGGGVTFNAEEIKTAAQYQIWGPRFPVEIVACPGLRAYVAPSVVVKLESANSLRQRNNFSVSLGVEGAVAMGFAYGAPGGIAEVYLEFVAQAAGAFEYKQEGDRWHFQGGIKLETLFAAGVRIAGFDFRYEFGKSEIGSLTGIRIIGSRSGGSEGFDGTPVWNWGPNPTAFFNVCREGVDRAQALANAPRAIFNNARAAARYFGF